MNAVRLFLGSVALLLTSCLAALAQSAPAPPLPAASAQPLSVPLSLSSFAAAHDSLLLRVARVRAQNASVQSVFKATQGTFGGLHRRIISYTSIPRGFTSSSFVVTKRQIIKHRFGIELEKVRYRDIKGRKLLTERYEGHQLTRLELFEYVKPLNDHVSSWQLVRGDYLRYISGQVLDGYKGKKQKFYFFRALPPGQ